nr:FAD-dependent monooxygenase [Mycobacterium szulgai]
MVQVVITGAGPNGLMLACELGLAGITPVVLDAGPGPSQERRAEGVVGQGVRIFDHRGLYETLARTTQPPQPAAGALFAGFPLNFTGVPDPQLFTLLVPQPKLAAVLLARAHEYHADIRWGHALTDFDQGTDGVTVRVAGPDGPYELTADYLVGADGGASLTRKLAGIDFPGMSSHDVTDRVAFGVLPPPEWVDPVSGALHVPGLGAVAPRRFFYTDRGIFGWGQLADRPGVFTIELDSLPRADAGPDDNAEPMNLAEQQASIKRVLGAEVPLQIESPDRPPDLRRICGVNSRLASRYRSGRVLLVGDAAHVQSPLGGPGMNLSLQDAVNLGWKLAAVLAGRVGPDLLDTYETERRPAAERVIMHSRAQLALLRPGPEVAALRELFAELLAQPGAVGHFGDLLSGADVCYAAGSDEHPLVGRWVPDFAVATGTGTSRVAQLARDGKPLLIDSPTAAGWRRQRPRPRVASPSPTDARSVRCRLRQCWYGRTVTSRGRPQSRSPMPVSCVACSPVGSALP